MEFKLARCSGILSRTAAALFLTDQSAHPSPRLWLQPCCQRSHSEGDAHTRTRRHPARLPYDRCKPSSIGRSPLRPRPATHAKSTSIPARAKSFEGIVWKCVGKRLAGHTPFYVVHSNKKQKKTLFLTLRQMPDTGSKGNKSVFFFLEEECSVSSRMKVLLVTMRLSEWRRPPFQRWTRYNLIFPHLNPLVIEMNSNYYLMLLKILLFHEDNYAYLLTICWQRKHLK